MSKRGKSIVGWSVVIALALVACSDGSGNTGGGTGNRGGSGGASGGAGGSAGSGAGGTGPGGSSNGGTSGSAGAAGKGGSAAGGTAGSGGKAGTGGTAGSPTGGAAGTATGGSAGAKDAGPPMPDGSAGGSTGGNAGAAGTGGDAGTGGGQPDVRTDAIDVGSGGTGGDAAPPICSPFTGGAPISVAVPSKGTATSLDIGGWNIEWFGDTGNGPSDENLQRDNVADVLLGTDMDVWGLAEVVSTSQFDQVLTKLPGYKGFLSDNALVDQGSQWYTADEQKLGFVYKCSLATVQKAKVILTSANTPFAGRPPLEVTIKVTLNGSTMDLVVIVVHAKCCNDAASWQRRKDAADALKPYLDSTYPTQKVIVVGDFNDDLDMSITSGSPTPYANFLADTANYTFISKALTDMKIPTTGGFTTAIDHHLTTNEMAAQFIAGSITAYNLNSIITNYNSTTTDHYPVLSRYNVP
jgi:endonuclease/exonuclease/phosphatase family metal-dependent hydrolase